MSILGTLQEQGPNPHNQRARQAMDTSSAPSPITALYQKKHGADIDQRDTFNFFVAKAPDLATKWAEEHKGGNKFQMKIEYNTNICEDSRGYTVVFRVQFLPNRWVNVRVTSDRHEIWAEESKLVLDRAKQRLAGRQFVRRT